jgi:type IV pilus assembly protein PilF
LLARSLVETQQWQEARAILRRYEKTSQISPQSLLMAIQIEQGTGNEIAAKGYSDMLVRIFPNDPVTKSMLTEQQSAIKMITQKPKPSVLAKISKKTAEKVELNPIEKSQSNALAESQRNDLITSEKESKIQTNEVTQPVEDEVEQLTEQVSEADILQTPEFHIVANGENLYRISLLYNIRMQRLIDWNGLADASAIFEGKKLSLVAPSVVE